MALKPMNDVVFGDPVFDDTHQDLKSELQELTASFVDTLSSGAQSTIHLERRKLAASLDPEMTPYIAEITAVGPDVKELQVGDTAILPHGRGTMVTVVDEETNTPERVYAIREVEVLARYRDD